MERFRALAATTLALIGILLPAAAFARAKTDVVFIGKGDRLTGEIKQLSRGILMLSTDNVGTVNIEWEDVDSLYSVYQFRVEEIGGTEYFGIIGLSRGDRLKVTNPRMIRDVPQLGVVAITPLEASFWDQLDGAISLGFSYTQSNSLGQLTGDINVRRRTPLRSWELDASAIMTSQEEEATQSREDVAITYLRLFEGRPFMFSSANAQSNDELGLELRLSFAVGPGLDLVQSGHNELAAAAGLSVNHEESAFADAQYNLEAFLGVAHSVFRYDYPKTDITTDVSVYPSLTSWGRVRAEVDISASREIVSDFTFVLSFYDSYDSDPLDPAAEENDYGIVTSIGWTF